VRASSEAGVQSPEYKPVGCSIPEGEFVSRRSLEQEESISCLDWHYHISKDGWRTYLIKRYND